MLPFVVNKREYKNGDVARHGFPPFISPSPSLVLSIPSNLNPAIGGLGPAELGRKTCFGAF